MDMHAAGYIVPLLFLAFLVGCATQTPTGERRISANSDVNYALDNNDNFSPDGKWLCFDTRVGPIEDCRYIRKINVETGEEVTIYEAPDFIENVGPGVGAVSYFPGESKVIFIHGPMTGTGLEYAQTIRTGAIVPDDGSGVVTWADARDATLPFTPGALRGGSHRHEPGGPGGRWIGYTYNDLVMKALGEATGRDLDLRTLGVTMLGHPVTADDAPGNRSGTGFSVVVVKVTPKDELDANPGADGIYRASGDRWVGTSGYQTADGSMQLARAFIGMTRERGQDGEIQDLPEVYIVDIPNDITRPGSDGPLEGTATTFPAPPAGTVQRRLTHTSGCMGDVRSTPDGSMVGFRTRDDSGRPQIFTVSPLGGEMTQITNFTHGAHNEPRWLPDGRHFVTVTNGRIVVVDSQSRPPQSRLRFLTDPVEGTGRRRHGPEGLCVSPDGKLVAYNRMVTNEAGERTKQIFVADVLLPE